MSEEKQS